MRDDMRVLLAQSLALGLALGSQGLSLLLGQRRFGLSLSLDDADRRPEVDFVHF